MIRKNLEKLVDELKRMKRAGIESVPVSEEALQSLRDRIGGLAAVATPAARPDRDSRPAAVTAPPSGNGGAAVATPKPACPAAPSPANPPAYPPPPRVVLPEGDKQSRWEALREQVLGCPICNQHVRDGCKVVFGVGNLDAEIFFVGEAPGADEEIQGEPFVGRAGELLTRMIGAMGIERSDVYIGNIMNWRPEMPAQTGNRPPTQEEMQFCLPYLLGQIEIVRPKVLVALGATAVAGLFGAEAKGRMRDMRGRWNDFNGTPTMVTYHPSYVLRRGTNSVKRTVWEDLLEVMTRVGLPISEKQRGYFLAKK